jgi:methenyltetrahydrofolate cyclohydrolase
VVAAAAALLEKCARLSARRWAGAEAALAQAHAIRLQGEELAEQDVHAYLAYVDAVRADQGVAEAQERTVAVPLEVGRAAMRVSRLAEELAVNGNPHLHADAVVAAILAAAAAESAAFLVEVNLGGIRDARLDEVRDLAVQAIERSRALRPPGS